MHTHKHALEKESNVRYLIIGGRSYKRITRTLTTNGARRSICRCSKLQRGKIYVRYVYPRPVNRDAWDESLFLPSLSRPECPAWKRRVPITKMRHLIYSSGRGISEGIRYRPGTFRRLITDDLFVHRNLSSRHDATSISPDIYVYISICCRRFPFACVRAHLME